MSFGGSDSPSNTQFATTFQREAPQIEAAKLGLMGTARDLTRFGMNPWEKSHPDAKFGEEGYGKYTYDSDTGPHARGTKWEDLSRKQRTQEGRPGGADLPTQTIAGFTDRQKRAFGMADEGIGKFTQYLDQAGDFARQATQQYDPETGYQQYMNPYQDEVIAGIQQQFGEAEAAQGLSAAKSGAFGGGREGIQRASLANQQAQTVGQAHAQNYGQAQQQAQQQFASQMGRYGEAAQQMAGLGGQYQQQHQADIASQMSAGSVEQQRLQQEYDAKYRADLQNLYEPYQRLGFTGDIYGGYPTSAMATSMGTAPGTNAFAQGLGGGITALAGAAFNQT
jgi:hypothetical protein